MAVLGVPFVDVVPTMIDASIPLTAVEWEEWGCPNEEKFVDYMMECSPVNNVKAGACLLTGGLHDPRVQFWEPSPSLPPRFATLKVTTQVQFVSKWTWQLVIFRLAIATNTTRTWPLTTPFCWIKWALLTSRNNAMQSAREVKTG